MGTCKIIAWGGEILWNIYFQAFLQFLLKEEETNDYYTGEIKIICEYYLVVFLRISVPRASGKILQDVFRRFLFNKVSAQNVY